MTIKNGRQWAKDLNGIRDDHKDRYQAASDFAIVNNLKTASDIGSGIGYGSWMLANSGLYVDSYEINQECIEFGKGYWAHENLNRIESDLSQRFAGRGEMAVCFELLEHIDHPEDLLIQLGGFQWLICSVPNEVVIPFSENRHHEHKRHYTPKDFRDMLTDNGWQPFMMGGQRGKHGEKARVQFKTTTNCRTLVAICKRG